MKLLLMLVLAHTPTMDYVKELRPHISNARAVQVSKHIETVATHHKVDPKLLAAIVRTESNFESGIKACWPWFSKREGVCRHTCDYGLAQINELWIRKWKLDPNRLQYDDRYNLGVAARILRLLQQEYAELEPENWFGRYHSGTPSKRAIYEGRLGTFLATNP